MGASFNIDHLPVPDVLLRLEGRYLKSPYRMFEKHGGSYMENVFVTASVAASF
jgi:hypothetical protein